MGNEDLVKYLIAFFPFFRTQRVEMKNCLPILGMIFIPSYSFKKLIHNILSKPT
jgi:hypothetical protein